MGYVRSGIAHQQASQWTPGGAQTASKAPGRVGPVGAFPLYARSGNGAYIWDVDGSRYVDWFNGNAAVILGHAHPAVTSAVERELRQGSLLSLPSDLEGIVAEKVCRVFGMEQARFVKTGSEACAAAVRIARIATGREKVAVLHDGYHGWHDWFQASRHSHPGVPALMENGIVTVANHQALYDLLRVGTESIALVMLEPCLKEVIDPAVLRAIVEAARACGTLVCFDEMICAPRWAAGGGTEYFKIQPDLVTGGKGFGNGIPVAFVAGSRAVMRHAWTISGTFGGETLGLAACAAVINEVCGVHPEMSPITRMWQAGQSVMDYVTGVCARLKLPFSLTGYAVHPMPTWSSDVASSRLRVLTSLLQQELAAHGILAHPSGWNASGAHDAEAILRTLLGLEKALAAVADAYHTNSEHEALKGDLIEQAFVARVQP